MPEAPQDLRLARCPVCRLARGDDGDPCARCGSDLSLVRAAYEGAWADVQEARRALARGHLDLAIQAAWRAVSLARTPTTLATLSALTADDGVG